jgi:hypothetical protein
MVFRGAGLIPPLHQAEEHFVEYLDLGCVEAVGVNQKKPGHLSQYLDPALRRAALDSGFQFRDQNCRCSCGHCQPDPSTTAVEIKPIRR